MSISAVAALLLLSGAPPAVSDVAPVTSAEIEPQQHENDPAPVAPPTVVPTIEPIPSSAPAAPATVGSEPPTDTPSSPDDIVVTARGEAPPGDPLQEVNITSYRVVQSVDKAIVAPVATGYQGIVPEPVRDGLGNALRNLSEPINFLNFLLQFKIGKAAETLGRFAVNTTFGVGGLFDVAKTKPFNLPYRRNGFANTLGFYGVEPGPYFYLPLVGPTTLRDLAGNSLDLLVLPTAVGAPFNRPAYAVPTTVIKQLNDRIEGDAAIKCLQEESADPYVETRTLYLEMRQREIDALKGKGPDTASPEAGVVTMQAEPSAEASAIAAGEPIKACAPK
jgi:phospholipid-binding lipoprotein MlaA